MSGRILKVVEIERLAFEALRAAGTVAPAAASLARAVAAAERDGIRSHGLAYLPTYVEHVRCGKVDGAAHPTLTRVRPSTVVVDAATGFAHPAIDLGFATLIPAARETGCAGMAVRNSYNCGVLGYHVEHLAEAGLVGLGFTNSPASIAPVGGRAPVLGTNPFALAVPGEGGPAFVVDQSSSVVAKSEIMMRARREEPIPEGWALDAGGAPTTEAKAALAGSMMPSGGYKGFGVALLVEVLAAALAGAALGKDASPFSGTEGGPPRTGQFFLALEPDGFAGGAFADRIQSLVQAIEADGGGRLPGSRRMAARARAGTDGVEIDPTLIERIEALKSA
ncbi:MAG: Ldh family oxidoreductase [Geminicoccaceae bacterium]|nr:Ldh family oxidoreductase [Geminicoccaceae bacterium]